MKHSLLAVAALAAVTLAGCAQIADFLESPTNAKVIGLAASAAGAELASLTGDKVSAEQRTLIADAAAGAVNAGGTGFVYWIAEELRAHQSTKTAAKSGALTAALSAPGVDPIAAQQVSAAVAKLAATGVSADAANEAIATAVQTVAQAKTAAKLQ